MTRAAGPSIGLAGCGYWGKHLARNLHQLDELALVCDANAAALASVRKDYRGVRCTTRFATLLEAPGVKAVALATPAVQHYVMARQALEAGKDVFVEKPLALQVGQAQELVALARRQKRVLMVGHILEYHPAIRKLHELILAGELGDLHYLYSNRANLGKVRREENILWSFAPHDISVLLLLIGRLPQWVSTHGASYLQKGVVDVTMTSLGFEGGTQAHVFVSWLHPLKEQKLVVIGSRKMAVFDDVAKDGKLRLYDKGIVFKNGEPIVRQTAESTLFFPEQEPLLEELRHFVACVKTRHRPITDGESGLRVLRVLDACQRSLEAGGVGVPVIDSQRRARVPR